MRRVHGRAQVSLLRRCQGYTLFGGAWMMRMEEVVQASGKRGNLGFRYVEKPKFSVKVLHLSNQVM
jgi:hypothetical protein